MVEHMVEPPRLIRRLEVITGAGGRRRWSAAEKARIVEEAITPGAVVSEIARRHGMSPQHLFTWRREALRAAGSPNTMFVPAVMDAPAERHAPERQARRTRRRSLSSGIELEIDGVAVRVGADANPKAIAAVIRALKAGS
jgi:transposase